MDFIEPRTSIASTGFIASASIVWAAKQLRLNTNTGSLLGNGIEKKWFKRNLLRFNRVVKQAIPRLFSTIVRDIPRDKHDVVDTCVKIAGQEPRLYSEAIATIIPRVQKGIQNLSTRSRVAVLVYLTLRFVRNTSIGLSVVADASGISPSTLYNSTVHVLKSSDIAIDMTLSNLSIHEIFAP
nr:hypothetical protein [Candidatus Sigynarchaeota archaeon]